MSRTTAGLVGITILIALAIPGCFGQLLKSAEEQGPGITAQTPSARPEATAINWGDKALVSALARNVTAGARVTAQAEPGATSSIIAVLRRKRAAGEYTGNTIPRELNGAGVPAMGAGNSSVPGGSGGIPAAAPHATLLGNAPAGGGMLAPAHTESATGSGMMAGTVAAPSNYQPDPSRHDAPGQNRPVANPIGKLPPRTVMCMKPGISAVDGTKSGAVFSPGYTYKIQGCGFGSTPGQIYLTGIRNQIASSGGIARAPSPLHSDWVRLLPLPGKWSDSYIEAQVDPATSGFYDSPNATLRIITSDNRTLWTPAFTFFAARAPQTLASVPLGLRIRAGNGQTLGGGVNFSPAPVKDAAGHQVQANYLSPSAASLVLPGHTFAVVREDNAASFPAGLDYLDLTSAIEPNGFEITSVQPFYADLPQQACPTKFSANGNWNVLLTGPDKVKISWQEQSCSINGISAYAMDVTVTGPKGVSPF